MHPPTADRSLPYLHGLLDHLATRLRRRTATRAALWTVAAAFVALGALVVTVAAARLPGILLLMGGGIGAAAVAAAWAAAYRPRPSLLYVARLVEGRRPELKNALLTFVELAADPSSDPSMRRALARRAARVVSRDPPAALLPRTSYRRPAWAAGVAGLVLGVTLWLGQGAAVAPWTASASAGVASHDSRVGCERGLSGVAQRARPEERREITANSGERDTERQQHQGLATSRDSSRDIECRTESESGKAGSGEGRARQDAPGAVDSRVAAGRKGGGERREGTENGEAAKRTREDGEEAPVEDRAQAVRAGRGSGRPVPQALARATVDGSDPPLPRRARKAAGSNEAHAKVHKAQGSPLAEYEPSTDVPEDAPDAMRRTKPDGAKADADAAAEAKSRPFLGRMGVSPADGRRYATAWQERGRSDTTAPGGSASPLPRPSVAAHNEGAILEPAGEADARSAVAEAGKGADERGGLMHAATSRVSPRLRPAVRAYFEYLERLGRE